jgi:hypothetical protein
MPSPERARGRRFPARLTLLGFRPWGSVFWASVRSPRMQALLGFPSPSFGLGLPSLGFCTNEGSRATISRAFDAFGLPSAANDARLQAGGQDTVTSMSARRLLRKPLRFSTGETAPSGRAVGEVEAAGRCRWMHGHRPRAPTKRTLRVLIHRVERDSGPRVWQTVGRVVAVGRLALAILAGCTHRRGLGGIAGGDVGGGASRCSGACACAGCGMGRGRLPRGAVAVSESYGAVRLHWHFASGIGSRKTLDLFAEI